MFRIDYNNCRACPRKCGVNRYSHQTGYCKTGFEPLVASICIHKGEEPVLSGSKGICNVFFSHCNMQCVYCQNYQISSNLSLSDNYGSTSLIVDEICRILDTGINMVGFVSPMHQINQMLDIIDLIHFKGYQPFFVYNTNAYDLPEVIDLIDPFIHVYLPDFKYASNQLAISYSQAPDYYTVALNALKRMIFHKGSMLILNNEGLAEWGIIIRHLVLPKHLQNTYDVLQTIASELSSNIAVSLMSQYFPHYKARNFETLNQPVSDTEYQIAVDELYRLGFNNCFLQLPESSSYYNPDFNKKLPFETE